MEDHTVRKKKKKRKNREVDEALDEEDLDLIGAEYEPREQTQVCLRIVMSGIKLTRS